MSFTGLATNSDTNAMHEDISDLVTLNAQTATPVLDMIGDAEFACEREQHQWREDSMLAVSDVINEGGTLNNSDLTFTVADASKFFVGALILIESEQMVVTGTGSPGANDITVAARGHGASDPATHADGTTVYIVGTAAIEGSDPPPNKFSTFAVKTNYTQIFMPQAVQISGTRSAIGTIGGGDRFEAEISKRLRRELVRLEWCVLNGTQQTSNMAGNATTPRTMQGVKYWLSSNVFDLAGAKLTLDYLEECLRQAWDNGADNMNLIICGSFNKKVISQAAKASQRRDIADERWIDKIMEIETDFFKGGIVMSRQIPKDEVLVLSTENIKVAPLQGRSFFRKDLPSTGDHKSAMICGEYTNETRHQETHVYIKRTATS